MRIAQVVCVFPPYRGGIGNAAYQFSKFLSDKGHEVVVFTPEYKKDKNFLEEGFNVVKLKPFLKYGNAAFLPQLFYRLNDFDIVYLHYPFFGAAEIIWFLKFFLRAKFKLIVHYHMDIVKLNIFASIFSLPSRAIFPSLARKAAAISCASIDYIKNSNIAKTYSKNSKKFLEIPFAVDIDKFSPLSNGEKDDGYLLFVGSLDKQHYFKGLDILLRAFKKIRNKKIKLFIVGCGNLRKYYEGLSKELEIISRVKFLGNVEDNFLPEYYKKASALILPSINRHEAFGIVILEALASGIPVVASNLPGVRRVFTDGVEGLLFNPGDVDDLAQKIDELLDDEKTKTSMKKAGRELAIKKYSPENIKNELNFLVESL